MKITCKNCGSLVVVNGLGRTKGKYPVQNVLNAYEAYKTVGAAAKETGLTKGTAWRILKEAGVLKTKRRADLRTKGKKMQEYINKQYGEE